MIQEPVHCRYCGTELVRNYMCFLWFHPHGNCAFRNKESKSHWGKDFSSEFGTNDFLPDVVIKELITHKAQVIPE